MVLAGGGESTSAAEAEGHSEGAVLLRRENGRKGAQQEPSARMASPGSPGSGAATWAVRGSSCHHGLLLGVWGPVAVFFCPCVNFSGCCHGNCQRHGAGGCVTGQLTYDNARIMRSRSLEAESSTTLGLVVLPSPCFCSAAAS